MERSAGEVKALRTILLAGVVAGGLDILAAFAIFAFRGVNPIQILQSISSGIFGRAAFAGGLGTAALGLFLQFLIATTAAAVYYVASRKLRPLAERPFLFGPLYGIAVYLFMNRVVLPLSNFPGRPQPLDLALIMVAVHIVCVGTPIALVVRRDSKAAATTGP